MSLVMVSDFEDARAQPIDSEVTRTYYRTLSESVSITSTFGSPGVPNQYTRSITESINITSSLPNQTSHVRNILEAITAPRTGHTSHLNLAPRLDERSSMFKLVSKKMDSVPNVVTATTYAKPVVLIAASSTGQHQVIESSEKLEPDDNSTFSRQLTDYNVYILMAESEHSAMLLHAGLSTVLLASTLGAAVGRYQATSSRGSRNVLSLFLPKHDRGYTNARRGSLVTYVLVVAVTMFVFISAAITITQSEASHDGRCGDLTCEQRFNSTSTFTVPEGISQIEVQAWGGGGAGGGTPGALLGTANGGGGGGGAYAKGTVNVTSGQTYDVVVAGSASGVNGGRGDDGSPSYFIGDNSSQVRAAGGIGGEAPTSPGTLQTTNGAGGEGGSIMNSVGDIRRAGGDGANGDGGNSGGGGGGAGSTDTGKNASGGAGGGPTLENGGSGANGRNNNGAGNSGSLHGGAGSGGRGSLISTTQVGGAGAAGLVIVTWANQPHPVSLHNDDAQLNQISFNNIMQDTVTPTFRTSATFSTSFARFQLELNTLPSFTGTSYTQIFSSGPYQSDVQYNLVADNLSPPFIPSNGETFYIRVRASADEGPNWSSWSTGTWTFTKGSKDNPNWFQTTDAQFLTGILSNTHTSGSGQIMLSSPTSGTILASEMDFTWTLNQASWGEVQFTTDETNGDIKIRVYSGGVPIPDDDLPGNSAGFDSSPIDISGLDVINYKKITLHATLTDSGGSPFLNDWAVTWIPIIQKHHIFVGQQENHTITDTIGVGSGPFALSVNSETNLIYIANFGSGTVSVINGVTRIVEDTITVDALPVGTVVNYITNRIYVSHFMDFSGSTPGRLYVIDGETGTVVDTITVGVWPLDMAVDVVTNRIYVVGFSSNTVSVIDGYTNEIIDTIPVGADPWGIALNPVTNLLYTANNGSDDVSVIDTSTNTEITTINVGSQPRGITINHFTNIIYVTNFAENTISVINGDTNTVIETIDVGNGPEGIAANPTTNRIYAGNGGGNTVSVINGNTNTVIETITVGSGPRWLVLNPVTDLIYVSNITDNNVSVIANTYTDVLTLMDSISKQVVKLVRDELELIDTITFRVSRSLGESLQVQDTITFRVSRSLGESLQVQDDSERTYSASRSVIETIALPDEMSKSVVKEILTEITITDQIRTTVSRTMTENISITDSITPSNTRPIHDNVEFTDLTERMYHATRSPLDEISIADSIVMSILRSPNDSVSIDDTVSRIYYASRSASDNLAITESITTLVTRSMSDSLTVTDSPQSIYFAARNFPDAVSLTDEISWQVSRSIKDHISVDDEMDTAYHASRQGDEQITINDFIFKSVSKHAADTVTINDSISISISRNLNDELLLSDNILGSQDTQRQSEDSLPLDDSISTSVTRMISEQVLISDDADPEIYTFRIIDDSFSISDTATPGIGQLVSDSVSVSDTISATLSTLRNPLDDLFVEDSIAVTKSAFVSISDELNLHDSASQINVFERSTMDSLTIGDLISAMAVRTPSENLSIQESASTSLAASRATQDNLSISDGISVSVSTSRSIEDALSVADSPSWSYSIGIDDEIVISDSLQRSHGIVIFETIGIADKTIKSVGRSIHDELVVEDRISVPILVDISDSISLSDNANRAAVIRISDSVLLSDSIFSPPKLSEGLDLDDMISISVTRNIVDHIAIEEQAEPPITGVLVNVSETIGLTDQITDVSVHWTRSFEEMLVFNECTPFACNQSVHLGENLDLGLAFVIQPFASDSLTVTDKIDFILRHTPPSTSLPPLNFMIASNKSLISAIPGVPVTGQFSMPGGNPNQFMDNLDLPIAQVGNVVSIGDLPNLVMVLPTYHISLTPSPDIPGDNSLVTVRVSEIPAATPVMVPVNISATPPTFNHGDFVWMTVEYTPTVDSFDFALIISILDSPPPGAQPPPGVTPLYLDIRWVGTDSMGNPLNLSDPNYFTLTGKPTVTFALKDSWAAANNVERDSNGVPMVSVNLFDGPWQPVTVTRPATATNGEYVYVAHLDHFSTYAVSAPVTPTSGGPSGGGGSAGGSASVPRGFEAIIADSVLITDSPQLTMRDSIEEPVELGHHVTLEEIFATSDETGGFSTLTIGENTTILTRVLDVTYGAIYPPTAKAIIEFNLQNRGDLPSEFILSLSYADLSAEAFEASHPVRLAPGESRTGLVEISFGTPGTFRLVMKAASASGETLAITSMLIDVPWIIVYFYLLLAIAASTLAISVPIALYLIRRELLTRKLA